MLTTWSVGVCCEQVARVTIITSVVGGADYVLCTCYYLMYNNYLLYSGIMWTVNVDVILCHVSRTLT